MQRYKNIRKNSGVVFYETGIDFIKIIFKTSPTVYLYSESRIAKHHIEKMKTLAVKGKGLGTYINQHPEVKTHYSIID